MPRLKRSILLIEDDPRDAEVLLKRWQDRVPGCHVIIADSFAAARRVFLAEHDFDCVCMDLRLLPDDPDGLRTLELVRNQAPGVLIVVVSGHVSKEMLTLFASLGGIYICKKGMAWTDLDPLFRLLNL